MANKKLKVEVELETAKAKKQAQEIVADSPASSSANSPSVKASDRLAKATDFNSKQMLQMTKAFSGMAIGLAASYSSRYFERGSTAEKALAYGGSAFAGMTAGATIGGAAGPQGAIIGGLAGGAFGFLKEYLDRDKVKDDLTKDYQQAEERYASAESFSNQMKAITSTFNGDSMAVKLARLSDQYSFYAELIDSIRKSIEDAISEGNVDNVKKLRSYLDEARSKQSTIWNIAESLDNAYTGPKVASRASTDALQKIGGGFGLPTSMGRTGTVEVIREGFVETNSLLREIRAITGKKGGSWL